MVHHILVIRAGALGDVVLTLPAIAALRHRYPHATIRAVGYPAIWEVAGPLIDEAMSIDSALLAGLVAGAPSLELHNWLAGIDLAVSWSTRDLTPALQTTGIGQVLSASPYPPPGVHAADWLARLVREEGDERAVPRLALSPLEFAAGRHILERLGRERPVFLHPGAGAAWKRWPAARFSRLAEELAGRDQPVVLVEGPADAAVIAAVQGHCATPLPVLRDLSPRRLAAALAAGSLLVGNDSGVSHLAAASGLPTVALFGPTDPQSWAPRGATRVLRACSRTTARQGEVRVCGDPRCLDGISVADVLADLTSRTVDNRVDNPPIP